MLDGVRDDIYPLLTCLWDYHQLKHEIKPADCIIVMGSQELFAAHRAAELYQQKMSDVLIFSGGYGKLTKLAKQATEAPRFAELAVQAGVATRDIWLEIHASNCAENIRFSMQLLAKQGRMPQSVILVCKPYLERRAFATFKQQFVDIPVTVTSYQVSLKDYLVMVDDVKQFINLMVGDLQRIIVYPAKGYQIPQAVPQNVCEAFNRLVELGFNQQIIIDR